MLSRHSQGFVLFALGCMLLGYALAAPVKLSTYFYPRPLPDLVIDGALVVLAVVASSRWLKTGYAILSMSIPMLALAWMKTDFILYSKSDWYYVISYGFVAWWGLGLVALWRFCPVLGAVFKKTSIAILSGGTGLAGGYYLAMSFPMLFVAIVFITLSAFVTKRDSAGRMVSFSWKIVPVLAGLIYLYLPKPVFFESQKHFEDKVVYSKTTRFQRIDVTEWKGQYWFYQDRINQFSSIDSWLYFEPFAHPVMQLVPANARVLVFGGENGMLARELRQYPDIRVDLIPVDSELLAISRTEPLFTKQHENVFDWPQLNVLGQEPFYTLVANPGSYDLIFVDVPDPVDIELNQFYTLEFYELCRNALTEEGYLVTQSGSPYFATAAFESIQKTMETAGFNIASYHNQVLTLGEWAWTLASKSDQDPASVLKQVTFENVNTNWLNNEAMQMMLSFGKPYVTSTAVEVNTIKNPVIYRYYNRGNYQLN